MANLPGGTISYTEVYNLVGEGGEFPVEVTIDYKNLGPKNWAIINIPAFTTPSGISVPTFQNESQQTFANFDIIKGEILIIAQNYFNGEGLLAPSFILKSTTKSQVDPNPTPQQVTEKTEQETTKKEEQQTITDLNKTDSKTTLSNTPPNLQPQGGDKLAIVLNKKRSEIKRIIIPIAVSIAVELGIKNLGTPQIKLPDSCKSQSEIEGLIRKRNLLVNRLNNIVKITDTLSKTLTGISLVLTILTILLKVLKTTRLTVSQVIKPLPVVPGVVTATLNDVKDIEDLTSPKIAKASGIIASANLAISTLNAVLLKIIAMLKSIDIVLNKCNTNPSLELTPLSPTLLEIEKINNEIQQTNNQDIYQETYNGFILEIVEESFSPTVNRRKAVAKNSQGIILLQTPLSFTTDDQTLLNQIKLLIDSNNLKAN